ncbi:MAG TPA: alkaline phosphatase family protein [Candidatus Udaeobacter sp.]|jgi:predicted AlkP superfamily phosphohydrolase/phosphomutase
MKTIKLLILGLDAATLDLINPWVAEGKLPNLAHLMSAGASGRLASVVPPITPPAWTSFMTGKNPGKHGIFDFLEAQPGTYSLRYLNASSRRAKTVWRMLNDAGYTVGTMNVPFTYPPEHLDGFQISGMATPSENSPFIYPPELRTELEGCLGRFRLDARYLGFMSTNLRRHQVLEDMKNLDDQWLRASLYLIRKHPADVMMFTFMSIDTVQHHFWQYMDSTHHYHDASAAREFSDAVFRVYQWLDDAVGRMLEKVSPDTSVFVVSDHGGGPTSDRVVYLNRYLAQVGLLQYKETKAAPLQNMAKDFVRWSYNLLRGSLSSRQKIKLANAFPSLRKRFESAATSYSNIDWSRTKAFCSEVLASPPGVRINRKGVKPAGIVDESEYEPLLKFITQKLGELRDPRTGEAIVKRVFRTDEIFHGPYCDEAADLILDWWDTSLFSTSPSLPEHTGEPPVEIIEHKPATTAEWGGAHRRDGILIAQGKPFRKGIAVEGARLIDMAPTILHLMGQPVPDDMDGRVLEELFEPEFIARQPIQTRSG